ncbi:prolipoprotein diacylglyceryl transferase [Donghicola sp. C2-DW-16]|uniref:Phosphatidylglycerol--prolipoprotein diacylglyceryl transferase n=1 Tax=Donghicola mangrovi TaxID=2729614 RepID=A0ABX2PFJ4_9RHOB|nr:prolipoprotein diacylglyceryl transferase [Donghicola mangrovi]NVO28260.1 prolipoprotein diacylglyceryl transferase [Donghicola mangrovi]
MQAIIPYPNFSPELFSIEIGGFAFALRWYALAYIAGLLIGWQLIVQALKSPRLWPGEQPPMTPRQVEDLLTWIIIGVILGGRLGFVLLYKPAYYMANPSEILMVWHGGMAFHGGFIGVVVASWLYASKYNIPKWQMADALAMATPAGLMLGRIANFINAELWGRPTNVPWAMIFPTDHLGLPRHPSQLYEAGLEGLLLGSVILWMVWGRKVTRTPGIVAGTFFLGYGLSRFVVEFFRESDPQFYEANPHGYALWVGDFGVSMGQLLSLPMVIIGIFIIVYARSRNSIRP